MIIGFTGTRNGMTEVQSCVFERLAHGVTEFHHGGCRGADVQAARIVAETWGKRPRIVCHAGPSGEASGVDDEVLPPKDYLDRNHDIVNACDELIACPGETTEKLRSGTWATIRYGRKLGKPITIIDPEGGVRTEVGKS